MSRRALAILTAAFAAYACVSTTPEPRSDADAFMAALNALCGRAFEGRMVSNDPVDEGTAFATETVVMHVRDCGAEEVRIPVHVGADRSRTWVLSRTEAGVRLKHDHRHEDGSPDAVTMYGGDSVGPSALRRDFPADAESRELFEREGLAASVANTWTIEIEPGAALSYQLSRPGRFFRMEFDLSRPRDEPPPPREVIGAL